MHQTTQFHNTALEVAGKMALERALRAHKLEIIEPTRKAWGDPSFNDDRERINVFIQSPTDGLGWQGSRLRWDGDFEWCGAFAAYAWAPFIKADLRKHYYASTYRLNRYANYKSPPNLFYKYPRRPTGTVVTRKGVALGTTGEVAGKLDLILGFGVREGDILIVNGKDQWGQHITVVEKFDPKAGLFHCVEGNATGFGPHGHRFQGVVRRTRSIAEARHLYRPGFDDLTLQLNFDPTKPLEVWKGLVEGKDTLA